MVVKSGVLASVLQQRAVHGGKVGQAVTDTALPCPCKYADFFWVSDFCLICGWIDFVNLCDTE